MSDLLSLFDELDKVADEPKILKPPFGYPGGKSKSIKHILPNLPYRNTYVEPFGGSAAVILSRHKSNLEVFNDRYAGVVAFYRCIRSKDKTDALIERLEQTLFAREEWVWCYNTWLHCSDDVERAARWYYMHVYSFGQIGRNFGRATKSKGTPAGKIFNRLPEFHDLHLRFRNTQVENLDWYKCLLDYDSPETVFYLDPPYLDSHKGAYKHEMSLPHHEKLLTTIFELDGFVAISSYSNPLYNNQPWDNVISWETNVTLDPMGDIQGNRKEGIVVDRAKATEMLYIKE